MKRILIIIGIGLLVLIITGVSTFYIWMENSVKDNIELVKTKYPGSAEDALIAFLQDESNSTNDKTHIAVWTLGQINSEKALPLLRNIYQDDPEGETCYGMHHEMICQYEIHKAIEAIEGNQLFTFAKFNK